MKTPSFILGASLIFWGWQTGLLIPAVIMALVMEGSRFVALRWDFSASDFSRISDLCTVIFLGMLVYAFASNRSTPAVLVVLQWLPMSLFPLVASQRYSTSEKIEISALFFLTRRKGSGGEKKNGKTINLTYPYFAVAILSASAANMRTTGFYLGLLFLSAWGLMSIRPKRYSLVIWGCLLLLAGSLGYGGQVWLHRLQGTVEDKTIAWFSKFQQKESDNYHVKTAIGDLGTLKISDGILFRVKVDSKGNSPLLLRESSYNVYRSSTWFARKSSFKPLRSAADQTTWDLQRVSRGGEDQKQRAEIKPTGTLTVSAYLRRNKGTLKLPMGAFQVGDLPVVKMEQNQYGTVKIEDGPGLVNYRVHYGEDVNIDSPPTEADLIVPPEEEKGLAQIVKELGGQTDSPQVRVRRLASYFKRNFSYSLTLGGATDKGTPLENFLLNSRSGHCEYFAAATVLLLRKLGVPARYAIGYSVHEFSDLENSFVVRQRHAHAWTLVYLNGAWRDFDTTPGSWIEVEEKGARKWGGLPDLWSWSVYTLSKWRWSEGRDGAARFIGLLLMPLIIILAWRVYRRKRVSPPERQQEQRQTELPSGADSEFYLLAERLSELGFVRRPGETLSNLLKRIEEGQAPLPSTEVLHSLLELHYRYRFDPKGISSSERSKLRAEAESWLDDHPLSSFR